MKRRIHVKALVPGELPLTATAAHHVRDVLRLEEGTEVEVFDDGGAVADGVLVRCSPREVVVRVDRVVAAAVGAMTVTLATAIPKANRADWMIEKLSELGVDEFIPLQTARSVVHPEGKNKLERWERLAAEAAKQSRRRGVMRVRPMAAVHEVVGRVTRESGAAGWYFSTAPGAQAIRDLITPPPPASLILFIGPEGGWTDEETSGFDAAGLMAVALTDTVLRVETAALAAAAVVMTMIRVHPV